MTTGTCTELPAVGSPVEGGVRPDWWHLRQYGYAPGHYMNKCHNCEHVIDGLDKRAIACKPCAEALHEVWSNPPCRECGAMTAQEAETKCHCGGDKDDCHGCQLWPD